MSTGLPVRSAICLILLSTNPAQGAIAPGRCSSAWNSSKSLDQVEAIRLRDLSHEALALPEVEEFWLRAATARRYLEKEMFITLMASTTSGCSLLKASKTASRAFWVFWASTAVITNLLGRLAGSFPISAF